MTAAAPPETPGASSRLHAFVRGRVQGVGFRAAAQYEARKLDLGGWVRNRADSSVEVEAEGDPSALERFLAFLQAGPPGAHVDVVNVEWLPSAQGGAAMPFEVRRTQ